MKFNNIRILEYSLTPYTAIKTLLFAFSLIFVASCSNPIEKKAQELKNCKVSVNEIEIKSIQLMLLPPVPKIYFIAHLDVLNTNEIPVTIEKFSFQISMLNKEKQLISIAHAMNNSEYRIEPEEVRTISVDMETTFENNIDSRIIFFLMESARGILNGGEIELTLEGQVEFNTILGRINVPVNQSIKTKLKLKK